MKKMRQHPVMENDRMCLIFFLQCRRKAVQEYVLIALDIFKEVVHNKGIKNELDAWLTFISCDEPERMTELMETHPQFKAMYQDIYDMCLNVERVMEMFSKELRELDKNTVQYMIEEQEKELERKTQENEQLKREVTELKERMQVLMEQLERGKIG